MYDIRKSSGTWNEGNSVSIWGAECWGVIDKEGADSEKIHLQRLRIILEPKT